MSCSPQRFLPNNLHVLRGATLTPSSVLPVTDKVLALPYARTGTAQVSLTGTYTGTEQADYDIEILDTDVEIPRVSTPTFSGAGSGTISAIAATGTQQTYTVELANPGTDTTAASVSLEGATISALVEGSAGNNIRLIVDQSTLTFTATNYSLLAALPAGQGGPTAPFVGQGFDWDCAVLDATTGLIPSTAHRIAFGDDESAVYLSYKAFVNGTWNYHLVPALNREIPAGTIIYNVTGGRTVTVTDGSASEVYPDIETAYDLLYALRTGSALVVVDGVVADDRSPTGQAARELALRTDAHAEVSSGSGSSFAKGFVDVTVAATAGTQIVTATCFATNSGGHPLARLGSERWNLQSSLLGDLGTVVTGVAFNEPAGNFALKIPVKLPIGYGATKGRFSVTSIDYADSVTQAPICPVSLSLGPDAVDQTITLVYKARPTGDCNCTNLPKPNLLTACLGDPQEGGATMAYQSETIARLKALHLWYTETARELSSYGNGNTSALTAQALANPVDSTYQLLGVDTVSTAPSAHYAQATESLRNIVANFESVLAQIDLITAASPDGLREDGEAAWDVAFAEIQSDVGGGSPSAWFYNIPSERYAARLNHVRASAGIPTVGGDDANTMTGGDGCWRDHGDAAWWEVSGSVKGGYAPLFTNKPYYSSRTSSSGGVFSTHEFALQLNVKCPEDLQYGDTVTLDISESGWGATYQAGDVLTLPIVAASPLYLTGGRTGNSVQTWNINGSVDGPLPAYSFNPDAPAAYSFSDTGASLTFLLAEGGIPWEKGDQYRFAVEGGHIRWRKDGGAWVETSPPVPIPLASVVIDAGLSATFTAGAAASFVAGDIYKFRALQPWAASNTQTPNARVWKWSGSSATYAADLGSVKQLDLIAFLHALPAGATAVLWGGATAPATDWSETLTYRTGCIWKAIDQTARYIRIVFTSATDGSLQFPWLGEPITTTLSAEVQLRRGYRINRPGGNLQGGRYVGKAVHGDVSWTESALTEADVTALAAMLDHVKENDDEPILFIPQVTRVAEAVLFARIASDDVDFPDHMGYAQNVAYERRVSASLPLEGVWQ